MSRKYQIVCLEGDGIAKDIVPPTIKVLEAVKEVTSNLDLEIVKYPTGAEYWKTTGKKEVWPSEAKSICEKADGIFKGPVFELGESKELVQDILYQFLRRGLDTYANLRPCRLLPGVKSFLSGKKPGDIDFVVIRENTEERYAIPGGTLKRGGEEELAVDVSVLTRKGCERVANFAFELAKKRRGAPLDGRKRVTLTCKYEDIRGDAFFKDIFYRVAKNYPDVETDLASIDAWTYWAIKKPEFYDVVVTTNQYGDIITGMAGAIHGSVGLSASLCAGEKHACAEATHGTAPRMAGKNIANPSGLMLSVVMLLRWMSEKHNDQALMNAANKMESAITSVISEGKHTTRDLGGKAGTKEFGDAVIKKVKTLYSEETA